ncbi:Actin-like protein [Argiope bruennichi]|uniref:Actin-like protein n=1 Tax=Argiope bruennichi TaxID=94029 RepID=A0A8T0FGD5_ARGBR|nr:Actin-like protein [Argiope bruennichi]
MTELSEANSTYLSTSNEEPELNSISFRQSLRFFQDQLILNNKSFPSLSTSRVTNNDVIDFTSDDHQVEKQMTLTKKDRCFDETSKSLNNNKISIPTVDTFLESVRVLRAIQKSQEQRGSSWSLNMSNSETDLIQHSLQSETIMTKDPNIFQSNNGGLPILVDSKINGNDMTSSPEIVLPERSDKSQSFWPSHKIICEENIIDVNNTSVNFTEQKSKDLNEEEQGLKGTSTSIHTYGTQNTLEKYSPDINEHALHENSNSSDYVLASTEEAPEANLLSITTDSGYNTSVSNETGHLKYEENSDFTDMSSVTSSNFEDKTPEIANEKSKNNDGANGDIFNNRSDSVQDDVFYSGEVTKEFKWPKGKTINDMPSVTSGDLEEESKEIAKEISKHDNDQNKGTSNNKLNSTQDETLHIREWTNAFKGSNDKTETQTNALDIPSFQFMHFRPESTTDTCSSYYMSAEGSPCASLQNDFEQTIHTFENHLAYSSQCVNNKEEKNSPMEEWTTDSSQICTNTENDSETRESVSSLSSTSIDINILEDHPMIDTLDASQRTEELLNVTSISTEKAKSINSDDESYHSCSLLECNSPSPSFTNINTYAHKNDLLDISPENRTNEINGNHIKEPTSILKSNDMNRDVENANVLMKKKNGSLNSIKITTLNENEDQAEIHGVKKFTTASWNLEAIVDSLYTLPEPRISKEHPVEKKFCKEVLVLSQGAFSKYPDGYYTLKLQQQFIVIKQENNVLLELLLKYTDIFVNRNILQLDNKIGRSVYIKCTTQEEATEMKEEIQKYCSGCWAAEQINLVHYPLKYHQNVVIIDLGSCSTRAGILMDQPTLPFLFFPSVCAIDKVTGNHVYGKEALQHDIRQNSNLSFPLRPSIKIIKHSLDVSLVGGIFKQIIKDLKVDPTNYTIQVCLPRTISIQDQNTLVKLLLEDMNVQSVSLTHQAILTLYAHNVSTGIVVDIGDRMDILPVVDGFVVENGVTRLPYGGQRLIHHMKHALAEKHISLSNDIDSFVVQYIAENLSYIAEDYENEMRLTVACPEMVRKSVTLEPFAKDFNCVQQAVLDDARFCVPEGLFKPSLWGLDNPGVHKLVQKAIQATGVDVRKKIAENIYVSGGVTMIPGFVERLLKELSTLNKPRIVPKVIASRYRYHCTYIGACEFARMEIFPKVCVNAEEYSKKQLASLQKFVLCF